MSALVGRQRGFTFIELIMTLAIMAILVLVAVPMAQLNVQRSKEHDLRNALIQIRDAIDAYKRASEQGRIRLGIGDSGYPPNLNCLVDGVVDVRSPTAEKLYFLRRLPADPFATSGARDPALTWGIRSYTSSAEDPVDGRDVFDVYSRSLDTGLNGVPYRSW